MTIAVKGTQKKPEDTAPSRERYLLKTGTSFSNVPVYFALLLTGLIVYLRGFFPSPALGDPQEQNSASPPASHPPHPEATPSMGEPAPKEKGDEGEAENVEDDGDEEVEEPVSTGSAYISREPAAFVIVDSPSIAFPPSEVTVSTDSGLFQVRPRAGNDNFGAGSGGGGGGSGDGGPGGGSGPGDDDGPGGDDDDDDGPPVQNRTPRSQGTVYLGDFVTGHAAVITFASLLQNSSDPDGDRLTIGNISVSSGTLTAVKGGWLYTPAEDFSGFAELTYTLSDGKAAAVQHTAQLRVVLHHEIEGTAQNDSVFGTEHRDQIDSRDGDDNIDALAGNDVVFGGAGDDNIVAGSGDDVVDGGRGEDVIFGGEGDDVISGGEGDDRIFGEEGDDTLSGDEGKDLLAGGIGNDVMDGGADDDRIEAGEGDDTARGGDGSDVVLGEAGNDVLEDGAGADEVHGGEGDDVMVASLDAAPDLFAGGEGTDTADYSATTRGVLVDLETGKAVGVEVGEDLLSGIEQVFGGEGDDTFVVGVEPVSLYGGKGDDEFRFSALNIEAGSSVSHGIHDFSVGDRISVSEYRISERAADDLEDLFEDIYGQSGSGSGNWEDGRPIRYRNERVDEFERTLIEADLDGDALYELSINLDGHHVLFIAENIA